MRTTLSTSARLLSLHRWIPLTRLVLGSSILAKRMHPVPSGPTPVRTLMRTSLHNYMQYLTPWSWKNSSRAHSSDLAKRPQPVAMLHDNITVTGQWIEITDMIAASTTHKRIINNVSMAFPHAGVPKAAHDPENKLMQPSDLEVNIQQPLHVFEY